MAPNTAPKVSGSGARAQHQPCHDPEASASAALQRIEKIGVLALVHDARNTVGGDDLRLQQARRRAAEILGKAAESSALHEPRNAYGRAAAPLDVSPCLGRHRLVGIDPHRTRLDGDGRLRPKLAPQPCGTNASCSTTAFIERVQMSSESGACEVPW